METGGPSHRHSGPRAGIQGQGRGFPTDHQVGEGTWDVRSRHERMGVDDFAKLVPESYLDRSGSVFFSGRRAFSQPSDLYVLALNPAGAPSGPHTIMRNIDRVLRRHPDNWSAYRDERWSGMRPGRDFRQRRVLHLFNRIGRDPGEVPTSETVFLRSTNWTKLGDLESLAQECWPFHEAVIETLGVRVIVCMGRHAGRLVRQQLNVHEKVDEFVEDNKRLWKSRSHTNAQGLVVVTLTHPSQAAWTVTATDPTGLVGTALSPYTAP